MHYQCLKTRTRTILLLHRPWLHPTILIPTRPWSRFKHTTKGGSLSTHTDCFCQCRQTCISGLTFRSCPVSPAVFPVYLPQVTRPHDVCPALPTTGDQAICCVPIRESILTLGVQTTTLCPVLLQVSRPLARVHSYSRCPDH